MSLQECGLDIQGLDAFLTSLQRVWPVEKRFERLFPEEPNRKARKTIDRNIRNVTKTMNDVIGSFKETIANLNSLRNNEAPINSLPEKVIVHIFDLAGDSGYDHECITRISWICALWRKISLKTPSLWRCIDFSTGTISPRIVQLYVERNPEMPRSVKILEYDCCSCSPRDDARRTAYERFLIKRIDSVRELELGCRIPNDLFTIAKPQPILLEALSIRCIPSRPSSSSTSAARIPEDRCIKDIFDGCPNLRYLCLDGCLLPSASTIYNGLKILKISSPTILPDAFDIFSIMRRTPSLEFLSLSVSDGESIFRIKTAERVEELIPVVHLKQLTLELPASDILHILSNITVSLSVRISLKDTSTSGTATMNSILPLDPRCLPCLSVSEKLSIDRQSGKIDIFRTLDTTGSGETLESEPFLTYSITSFNAPTVTSLTHLTLNLPGIHELAILEVKNQSEKFKAGDLVTLLRLVPDIRRLRLHSCDSGICQLFATHAQHGRPRLCHVLEAVYLEDMALKERDVVAISTSLAPHGLSVSVLKCWFENAEEKVMKVLETVQGIDLQVSETQFEKPISSEDTMTEATASPAAEDLEYSKSAYPPKNKKWRYK
ncbi:hypothetical protein QCA50_020226 [Cerrena zonata]|uniref:F-box domain-containing protein n=1 Tax=Cerrena zonata TaxID=2478898 RepID=A0AAW0FD17_9APHY